MSQPLVVTISHSLGQEEATRRIKAGLARARGEFKSLLNVEQENWTDNRVDFTVSALMQRASGSIEVHESDVRLVVTLPWLLQKFAEAAQRVIGQKGQLMLEKK